MGYFYCDESIHDRGNFILWAFVYCKNDLTPQVYNHIGSVGLTPKQDEFKSSYIMDKGGKYPELRENLRSMFMKVNIGLVIVPIDERKCFGDHALKGLKKIIINNKMNNERHDVYFDQGIMFQNRTLIDSFGKENKLNIYTNQDSKIVAGLQMADLTAHTLSIMFLETLGLIKKQVTLGKHSGYSEDELFELSFDLWGSLRYSLFSQAVITIEDIDRDPVNAFLIDTGTYCLYVKDTCSAKLKEAAENRFGRNYVGCIH